MKTSILLISAILLSTSSWGQNWNEWFRQKKTQRKYLVEQIAALKIYLKYLKEGYDIAKDGLKVIGNIKDGSFKMDKDYFTSLKDVNPAISGSGKVRYILACQSRINKDLAELAAWSTESGKFSENEVSEITRLRQGLLQLGEDSLEELTVAIAPSHAEMTDDERMQRIEKIYKEMQTRYVFVQNFTAGAKALSLSRVKEQHDVDMGSICNEIFEYE